jgi:hypothetical protein
MASFNLLLQIMRVPFDGVSNTLDFKRYNLKAVPRMPTQQSCKAFRSRYQASAKPLVLEWFLRRQKQAKHEEGILRRNEEFNGTLVPVVVGEVAKPLPL